MLCSLCSGVGPVPTVLVSSIRSCPGRLASVSPYITHIHREKEPLIRAIRPFFIFPFSALLYCGGSEIHFQLFLAGVMTLKIPSSPPRFVTCWLINNMGLCVCTGGCVCVCECCVCICLVILRCSLLPFVA